MISPHPPFDYGYGIHSSSARAEVHDGRKGTGSLPCVVTQTVFRWPLDNVRPFSGGKTLQKASVYSEYCRKSVIFETSLC